MEIRFLYALFYVFAFPGSNSDATTDLLTEVVSIPLEAPVQPASSMRRRTTVIANLVDDSSNGTVARFDALIAATKQQYASMADRDLTLDVIFEVSYYLGTYE